MYQCVLLIVYFVRVSALICAHLIVCARSWGHVSYPKPNGLPGLMKWNGTYLCMYWDIIK